MRPKTSKKLIINNSNARGVKNFDKLEKEVRDTFVQLTEKNKTLMANTLSGVAQNQYYDGLYEAYKGVGMGQSFDLLTKSTIQALITNPVMGETWITRNKANANLLNNQINQELRNGVIQGLSNNEIATRVAKKMGSGYEVAKRLVDTEIANTLNQSALLSYENSGIVEQFIFIATLDNRTSDICTDLDGQVFDLKDAVTGINVPPMHVRCRSTTSAYFDYSAKGLTRMARDLSGNNFVVPGNMSVKDFKSIYVEKTITRKQWDRRN